MGRNETFAHLQVFFTVVGDLFGQLVGMRQKKIDVEGARLIEHLAGSIEGGSFLGIGSSLGAVAQVKKQFGGPVGLSHRFLFPTQTNVRTSI